jgi:hypothetical protein
MRRASKAGEKKKQTKTGMEINVQHAYDRKFIPTTQDSKEFGLPNALTHPKPRSTKSIQFQHYYYPYKIAPLEGVTQPKLQLLSGAGISKRKALSSECHKNTERLQLGNHQLAAASPYTEPPKGTRIKQSGRQK